MRTSNPALSADIFEGPVVYEQGVPATHMTVAGTTIKTGVLVTLAAITAGLAWMAGAPAAEMGMRPGFILPAALVGLVLAMVTIFKKTMSPFTAPLYAMAEGVVMGGMSVWAEAMFPGIAFQALVGTMGTLMALLVAYRSGFIAVTENFRLGVVAATGGIMLLYMASFVMRMFGAQMPLLHETGLMGIGISVFIVGVAALNLVLDFDFIERGEARRAPKFMEWYGAFGLMVTLVWLYLEMLRLLMKLRSND